MSIRVVNLSNHDAAAFPNEVLFRIGGPWILGNPFVGKDGITDESKRDELCDKYDAWFNQQIEKGNWKMMAALHEIIRTARVKDIALGCYCAPRRCHAETIKRYIENKLQEGTK
jgi:hypothetical protein